LNLFHYLFHYLYHPPEQETDAYPQLFDKRYDRTSEVRQTNQICSGGVCNFRNEQVNQDITQADENIDYLKI